MFQHESDRRRNLNETASACNAWCHLLPDAADGLLSEPEQLALDRHIAQCATCAEELAEARRGAAWLGLLKDHAPEPPADLLGNILAQTTGRTAGAAVPALAPAAAPVMPVWDYGYPEAQAPRSGLGRLQARLARWLGLDQTFAPTLQPRLAMTSAMAFFSVCLTLNLLGFSVHDVRAEVLHPAWSLQRTAAETGASLVRSFEGIRVVYRMESRVNAWRTAPAFPQTDQP